MKGQINLGAWVLITAIVAIIILLIFDSTIRSYIVTNLSSMISGIKSITPGQASEVITNFTAYNCSSVCSTFSSSIYFWTINFNGQNYSAYLNSSISIVSGKGNYSLVAYPILSPYGEECANGTSTKNYVKKLAAGKNYVLDYSIC